MQISLFYVEGRNGSFGKVVYRVEAFVRQRTSIEDLLPRFYASSIRKWTEYPNGKPIGRYRKSGYLKDGELYRLSPRKKCKSKTIEVLRGSIDSDEFLNVDRRKSASV